VTPNRGSVPSAFGIIFRPTFNNMIVSTGMHITRCTTFYCLQLTQCFSCNRQSVLETWYGKLQFYSWFVGRIYFFMTTQIIGTMGMGFGLAAEFALRLC
jgi:heme/copper-type cytochrome/quinol oxidase subunit 1